MNLAEKLTIQRKKSGMSQEQFADRLGITRQSVSKWEAGSSIPEISKLVTMGIRTRFWRRKGKFIAFGYERIL